LAVDLGAIASGEKHASVLTNKYCKLKSVIIEHGIATGQVAQITGIDKSGRRSSMRTIDSEGLTLAMP
jgi:predicted transcriptional regulator